MGVALLYAYRAQSPSATVVSYDKAITEIRSGQVQSVTISGDTATVLKTDKTPETVSIGANDATLGAALFQCALLLARNGERRDALMRRVRHDEDLDRPLIERLQQFLARRHAGCGLQRRSADIRPHPRLLLAHRLRSGEAWRMARTPLLVRI